MVKAFIPRACARASAVFATECCKALVAYALRARVRTRRDIARSAPLALLYCAQNALMMRAYDDVDAVTVNCLNQTKLASAAAFAYVLSGTKQSAVQIAMLSMVTLAGVVVSATSTSTSTKAMEAMMEASDGRSSGARAKGVVACAAASALSGFTSALGARELRKGKSATELTLEMAIVSAPAMVVVEYLTSARGTAFGVSKFFAGWNARAFIPVFTSALGGLAVGEITKRLEHGAIAKGFAVVGGLVLTGLFQSATTSEAVPASHVAALFVVLVAVYVHTVNPPIAIRLKKMKKKSA